MTAYTKMTATETRIFLREKVSVFWALLFPTLLLVVLGLVFPPDPDPNLGGIRLVDVYAPVILVLALLTAGVMMLPVVLVTYRERGVLRRLFTTPVAPRTLLQAQLTLSAGSAIVASLLAVTAGVLLFDLALPQNPLGFVLAFLLATASIFALGMLAASLAKTSSSSQGISMAIYFPALFFSGVYFPREVMPDGLRTVSDFTPVGAAAQAFSDTWAGNAAATSNLVVMAVYAIVVALVAARLFRWQ